LLFPLVRIPLMIPQILFNIQPIYRLLSHFVVCNMGKQFSQDLIAPCGMNCNVCSGYLAVTNNVKSKGVHLSYCIGCRPREKKCAFLKKRCKRLSKHSVQFCYECPDYPCEPLRKIDARYRTFFRMSLLENLTSLQKNGMDSFLRAQEEKWRCPTCGGTVCCHNGLCFHCDIETLKTKKKKYRWDDE
jgi:hypothetical protein